MRPFTVVHVTSSKNRSGGTRQAILLLGGLCERGHRVLVCAPPASPALAWAKAMGVETHALPCDSLREQWRASRALRRLAAGAGADVVHAHHTKGHNAALLATFGGHFPPVVANRGVVYRPEFPAKFRSPRTAAVITNSARVKRVLAESGVPDGKVHVIYNAKEPPDPEEIGDRLPGLRDELSLTGHGPVVGTVGNARPAKGFQHLIEAAPEILRAFPEALFVLVGAGTEGFARRLDELGIASRFRLTDHREDAVAVMSLFDAFVLPSIDMESCPNVVLEAMGAGLPVVGTDIGGVAEIVEDGRTGLIVPPGQPDAIAGAVKLVLGDSELAQSMGEAGRKRLISRFTLDRKVNETLDVYRGVLRS